MTAAPAPPNTITMVGSCDGHCSPAAQTGALPIDDPYASVVALPIAKGTLVAQDRPLHAGAGHLRRAHPSQRHLQPATGAVLPHRHLGHADTNTLLKGTGVTLYGTCGTTVVPAGCASTGEAGGGLDGKNSDTQITAPTSSPATASPRDSP